MGYENINIHVGGPEATKLKEEIRKAAESERKSISSFFLWLYESWKKKPVREGKK